MGRGFALILVLFILLVIVGTYYCRGPVVSSGCCGPVY